MGNQLGIQDGEISVGPFGGSGGQEYNFTAPNAVKQIIITHSDEAVESLIFRGDNKPGTKSPASKKLGGGYQRRIRTDKVTVDFPEDFLIGVSGTFGKQDGFTVIKSLTFYTHLNEYGPFGSGSGTPFSFKQEGWVITGFHGCSGPLIDSIGFILKPHGAVYCPTPKLENPDFLTGINRSVLARNPGPWGGNEGRPFDDGVSDKVTAIHVHLCSKTDTVCAVQFQYLKGDETRIWSPRHGSAGSQIVRKVEVGEDETLTGIEGFYGAIKGGGIVISSLTFHTDKGGYGPLGLEVGSYFTSTATGKIVGFFGNYGQYLNSIGVHMEYF